MGITSSLFNGYSGMGAMSKNMSVLADNLANVNTIAFKTKKSSFDQIMTSAIANAQIGDGARLDSVTRDFSIGHFEPSPNTTDMAVNGEGFFMLRDATLTASDLYTRDGQFRLIENTGSEPNTFKLVNQMGHFVQGYNLNSTATSSTTPEDILIKNISLPQATEEVELVVNIENQNGALATSNVTLFDNWDGTNITGGEYDPISENNYAYKTDMSIYDALGDDYNLTFYFDHTANPNEREFLVTCNPGQDKRLINAATGERYNSGPATIYKGAGALLYGIMNFNTYGDFVGLDCWDVPSDCNVNLDLPNKTTAIQLSRGEANYSFSCNFAGTGADQSIGLNFGTVSEAMFITSPGGALSTDPLIEAVPINENSSWSSIYDDNGKQATAGDTITFTGTTWDGTPAAYSYTVNTDQTVQDLLDGLEGQFGGIASIDDGNLMLTDVEIGASQLSITSITHSDSAGNDPATNTSLAQVFGAHNAPFQTSKSDRYQTTGITTTAYGNTSYTLTQTQDGFPEGYLEEIFVDKKGIINGRYTTGEKIAQAQIALANFVNLEGLELQGGNLLKASSIAGNRTVGIPDQNVFGEIEGMALEMSNVDLGLEFANLILTQRAFQANSKSIVTADELYEKVINLKR